MMKRVASLFVGSVAVVMVGSAVKAQQVTIGPMTPSGAGGQQVGFNITYTGPTNTNGISFNIMYPPSVAAAFTPVFRTGSTTRVQCATAADLDPGITTTATVLASGKIAFTVIGLSLDTGPIAFGRTGVVGTCQFTIAQGASGSVVPLTCDTTAGQTTASDVTGANLAATCVDGTLTVSGTPVPTNTSGPSGTPTNTPPTTNTSAPTATRTNTPVPTVTNTSGPTATRTNTPVATVTGTPVATATRTVVPTATATSPLPTATATITKTVPPTETVPPGQPTPTPQPAATPKEDDDGCQISTTGAGSGWLLLLPAATLLVLRRKRR